MTSKLYTRDILRLAASLPGSSGIESADASARRRSLVCGSEVSVDLRLGADGRVEEIGQQVRACALGQASAALLAKHIIGRQPAEVAAARDDLAAFLTGARVEPGEWPGLQVFAAARAYPARHAAILLPFDAAIGALETVELRSAG